MFENEYSPAHSTALIPGNLDTYHTYLRMLETTGWNVTVVDTRKHMLVSQSGDYPHLQPVVISTPLNDQLHIASIEKTAANSPVSLPTWIVCRSKRTPQDGELSWRVCLMGMYDTLVAIVHDLGLAGDDHGQTR